MGGISWGGVGAHRARDRARTLTYNPAAHSFYHPLSAPPPGITAEKAFAAASLPMGWIVCLRTAFVALGVIGIG